MQTQRVRYACNSRDLDLYDIVDGNELRRIAIGNVLDALPTDEREFMARYYGLLGYDSQSVAVKGPSSFGKLAEAYNKDQKCLWRWHRRIIEKIRASLP